MMIVIGTVMKIMEQKMMTVVMSCPRAVIGLIFPYPIVPIVVIAHQQLSMIL